MFLMAQKMLGQDHEIAVGENVEIIEFDSNICKQRDIDSRICQTITFFSDITQDFLVRSDV